MLWGRDRYHSRLRFCSLCRSPCCSPCCSPYLPLLFWVTGLQAGSDSNNWVISDVKALKRINEGDTKGFVRMFDQVEQCWLDLKKNINLEEELNTANVVSHIERVLPTLQKREWVIRAEEVLATRDLFPTLLKFLQKERKVLEYMNSSIRTTGTEKASVHRVSNESNSIMELEVLTLIKQMNDDQ